MNTKTRYRSRGVSKWHGARASVPRTRIEVNRKQGRVCNSSATRRVRASVRVPEVPTLVRWSFFLFVFAMPFEYLTWTLPVPGSFTITRASGMLFFALCCWYPKKCFSFRHPALWWFLGFVMVYIVSSIVVPEALVGAILSTLFTLIQLLVFFTVAVCLLVDEKLARSVLLTFCIGTALLSFGSILNIPGFSIELQTSGLVRASAEGFNPNYLAYITTLATVALVGLYLNPPQKHRMLWHRLSLAAMTIPAIGLTVDSGSRAAIGALILGLCTYALPFVKSRRKVTSVMMTSFVLVVVGYLVATSAVSSSRILQVYDQGNSRASIFKAAGYVIAERPFLGWNNQYEYELGKRLNINRKSAHNLFLEVFLVAGSLGAGAFLAGLWLCFRCAWRARSGRLGLVPLALLVTVIVDNQAHVWLLRKPTWLFLALAAAAAANHIRTRSKLRRVW